MWVQEEGGVVQEPRPDARWVGTRHQESRGSPPEGRPDFSDLAAATHLYQPPLRQDRGKPVSPNSGLRVEVRLSQGRTWPSPGRAQVGSLLGPNRSQFQEKWFLHSLQKLSQSTSLSICQEPPVYLACCCVQKEERKHGLRPRGPARTTFSGT